MKLHDRLTWTPPHPYPRPGFAASCLQHQQSAFLSKHHVFLRGMLGNTESLGITMQCRTSNVLRSWHFLLMYWAAAQTCSISPTSRQKNITALHVQTYNHTSMYMSPLPFALYLRLVSQCGLAVVVCDLWRYLTGSDSLISDIIPVTPGSCWFGQTTGTSDLTGGTVCDHRYLNPLRNKSNSKSCTVKHCTCESQDVFHFS